MRIIKIKLIIVISIILTKNICFAEEAYDPYLTNDCKLSMPIEANSIKNLQANSINDLTKEHNPYLSNYDKSYIYGRVLDQDCKPLSDVNIKIWQSDDKMLELSGMTTSNNLGEFIFASFIPHYNIKLKILTIHDEYFPFLTSANLTSNDSFESKKIKLTSSWLIADPDKYNQSYIYHQDIVIPIENLKTRY